MIRFGILGAGTIARRFARSLSKVEGAELVAASRRTRERAQAFLAEQPCAPGARAYGSHEALLADPDIDAIYLSLPHALHLPWALRAIEAGKAVLCEKPAMLTAADMSRVASLARGRGVLFMEAMKPRFVPLHEPLLDALDELGDISYVSASLCNDVLASLRGTGSYHLTPGPGSGVLLDCGVYCASWIEEILGERPRLRHVDCRRVDAIDVYVDARLEWGGIDLRLECAFDRATPRALTVVGSLGTLVVEDLHRPQAASLALWGKQPRRIETPYEVDDFYGEIRHFTSLMREGVTESPLMTLDDSICTAALLDDIRLSIDLT
ncbi:Gfo/Idh/MocA family protein [Olsenella massiliensis]|uniref:Gfo/Idh/MocA family protein n=1 Tax=Olsenella massiliensis TaxID=1622075 RepID=UPI00071DD899|nr:Gfo/Idh/MocA family oxidoreductase [Olsenella massiliensis]